MHVRYDLQNLQSAELCLFYALISKKNHAIKLLFANVIAML